MVCPATIKEGSEESECTLSRCLVCLATSQGGSEERARMVRAWRMLPGEVTRAEWHQLFSLDEIYKFETPTAKTIPALNNDLKFFLLQKQNHNHVKITVTISL